MSVINQVLIELEKRGANTPLGEAAIRVVPPRKQSPMRYVFFALALSILAGGRGVVLGAQRETVAGRRCCHACG